MTTTQRQGDEVRVDGGAGGRVVAAGNSLPGGYMLDPVTNEIRRMTVFEAIAAVKRDVRAVSKDRQASGEQGGYKFRGIEGVLGAVHEPSGRHGLVIIPRDKEIIREAWKFYKSDAWTMYRVHIVWTIIGPDGSMYRTANWGEALDNADKGLGKARSYAQKDLLIRLFEIPTSDADVSDTESSPLEEPAERSSGQRREITLATEQQIISIINRLTAVLQAEGDYPQEWRDAVATNGPGTFKLESLEAMATGDRPFVPVENVTIMNAVLDTVEQRFAHNVGDTPCIECGSAKSDRLVIDSEVRCANVTACRKRQEKNAGSMARQINTGTADTADPTVPRVCASCGSEEDEDGGIEHANDCPERPM